MSSLAQLSLNTALAIKLKAEKEEKVESFWYFT